MRKRGHVCAISQVQSRQPIFRVTQGTTVAVGFFKFLHDPAFNLIASMALNLHLALTAVKCTNSTRFT